MALNYRPVSLISEASKIFENISRDKFVKFLEDKNIISDTQHCFKIKNCSVNFSDFFHGI